MKVFFKDIRAGRIDEVRRRLDAKPDLVHATATAPPRKDDGQSPLQVAIKSANFPIAHLLMERGADVHFIEQSELNHWRIPVLQDAVMAAVFSAPCTFHAPWAEEGDRGWTTGDPDLFEDAMAVLDELLDRGAAPAQPDSVGNTALMRACIDASSQLRSTVTDELRAALHRVFDALLAAGADPSAEHPRVGRIRDEYARTPVAPFLRLDGD